MFCVEAQLEHPGLKAAMPLFRPALAPVWLKIVDQNTQRSAGLATIAIGPVSEHATAAKALRYQIGIRGVVDQMARAGNL